MSNVKRVGLPSSLRMRHDSHFIDQLGRAAGSPIGQSIPIEDIDPNPNQPRQNVGDLSELIASIREKGVLEPILVRRRESRFQIVAGERRYRAAIEAGLPEMPCVIKDLSDPEVMEIALIENLQRKDLTPFEEAEGLEALATRYGYTHELIAQRIGKSRSTITEALSIATLPADVKDLCRRADISSKSLLLQVVRLKDATQQRAFVERIRNQGMTRDEARAARKPEASTRPRPYEYRFQPVSKEFSIQLRFKRSQVTDSDLAAALRTALGEVEARLGSKRTRS